ncbi:ATP-binding cassette domain-containing protein [Streptomyces sp. NPDC001219]
MGQVKGEAGASEPVLKVGGLRYEVADRVLLDGVNLQVCAGESAAVVGPSGSGKSTLLGCVLGLIRPAQGKVEVAGQDVVRMRQRALERHRSRHMGVVFQFGELLPELTPVGVGEAGVTGGSDDLAVSAQGTIRPHLAEFLRFSRKAAPLSVLTGKRKVYYSTAAWALLVPLLASIATSVIAASWLAAPQERAVDGVELSGDVLAATSGALAILALLTWWWGASAAVRESGRWRPYGE